jgi:hypothetical protein
LSLNCSEFCERDASPDRLTLYNGDLNFDFKRLHLLRQQFYEVIDKADTENIQKIREYIRQMEDTVLPDYSKAVGSIVTEWAGGMKRPSNPFSEDDKGRFDGYMTSCQLAIDSLESAGIPVPNQLKSLVVNITRLVYVKPFWKMVKADPPAHTTRGLGKIASEVREWIDEAKAHPENVVVPWYLEEAEKLGRAINDEIKIRSHVVFPSTSSSRVSSPTQEQDSVSKADLVSVSLREESLRKKLSHPHVVAHMLKQESRLPEHVV